MKHIGLLASTFSLACGLGAAQAADLAGSKDPPFLKRYEGSEIVFSMTRSFDEYKLIVPDTAHPGKTTAETREGKITRIIYRVPAGHTALELFRNYEYAVKDARFLIAYEGLPCQEDGARDIEPALFGLVKSTGFDSNPGNPFQRNDLPPQPDGPFCFFTAKGNAGGQDIGLTVAVGEKHNRTRAENFTFTVGGLKAPIVFAPGEMVAMVDVVASKAVETKMVIVKAADIADALAVKGMVALYGIYFDTDKTDVKPESKPTLDEVASLMKIDRALKLEISGHTDNTGAAEHNMKLSEGRAQAVVAALVKDYGIAPSRLQAKGYGDSKPVADNASEAGRANNRRVELRKM